MDQQPGNSSPPMCASGCGFFGNPANENMCSKCYRDLHGVAPTQATPAKAPEGLADKASGVASMPAGMWEAPTLAIPATPSVPIPTAASPAAAEGVAASPPKVKRQCFTCKKNVGLLGFACRCEHEFCAKHRDAKDHSCTFDYKSFDRSRIERANPVIAARKVPQI